MSHDNNEHQTFLHATPAQPPAHQAPSVQVHSGVVRATARFSVPHQEAMQAPIREATRVSGTHLSWGPGGEVREVGVARHVHSDSGVPGASVMSTLRTGSNPSVCMVPGDESTRISLASAERDGLVVRDASGRYVDAGAAPASTAQQEQQQSAEPQQQPQQASEGNLSATDAEALNEAIADIPQQVFDSTLNRGVDLVLGTRSAEQIASDLARDGGVPQDEARALVENVGPLYQKHADAILARQGLEGEDLAAAYAWMRESRPQALAHVVRQFLLAGDPAPLRKLAGEWQEAALRKGSAR